MEPASSPAPARSETAPPPGGTAPPSSDTAKAPAAGTAPAGTAPAALAGTVSAPPAGTVSAPEAGQTPPGGTPPGQTASDGTGSDEFVPRLAPKEGRRPRDMVISLLVLLVPIALFMTYYSVVLDGDRPHNVKPAWLAETLAAAGRVFPVAQAAGLSTDWYITSAQFRREAGGGTLRLGYVDPDENPILMVQSNVAPTTLVPAEVGAEGERIGAYRTDRRTWLRYTGRPGETALIVTEQDRTIVILGEGNNTANLEKLAASLP